MKTSCKIFIIILSIFIFSVPLKISADTIGIITGNEVRIRSLPDTTVNNIVAELDYPATVSLIDTTKYPSTGGNGCENGWYKINYNSSIAYVCSSYISFSMGLPEYNTSNWVARIKNSGTRAQKGPSYSTDEIETIVVNSNVIILDSFLSHDSCTSLWYKVKYSSNNKLGYVCGTDLTFRTDVTLDDDAYETTLQTLGFPESYWPYLSYLHSLHPDWVFIASITNLNWNDVIRGEKDKNLIQSTDDNYRVDNIPKEGSSWFTSKDSVNAFYIDPRNFLQEKYVFMFEKLNYDASFSSVYPGAVKAVFGSSYLSADEYVNYFVNAGLTYGVSPVHLAARSSQEGCRNENYDSISGNSTLKYRGNSLVGYYNYFNIGAHKDTYTTSPVARGLAYAAGLIDGTSNGRPWNTRNKAIMGGASFLSNNYISKGQFTLYYQKFNTSPYSTGRYTHQYMTNVQAPSSESSNTYKSYTNVGVLNNVFMFEIPVYKNMPDYTSLPSGGSGNNYLSKITIDGKELNGFDKDVVEYSQSIPNDKTSITINATAENSLSIILGTGEIQLTSDTTNVDITVVAENGDIKTYKIEIVKVVDNNSLSQIMSSISYKSDNDYIYGISKNNTALTIINNILKISPSSTVTITSFNGDFIPNNTKLATGQMITIETTNNETQAYDIVVTGDVNGDGQVTILDLLKIQKHLLKAATLSDSYLKAGDTNFDKSVTILDLLRIQKSILGKLNL